MKRFVAFLLCLVICLCSFAVPASYAENLEDVPTNLPTKYYYYGNSDYLPLAGQAYNLAAQHFSNDGVPFYENYAIVLSGDKVGVYCYSQLPEFQYSSSSKQYTSYVGECKGLVFTDYSLSKVENRFDSGYDFMNEIIYSFSDSYQYLAIGNFSVLDSSSSYDYKFDLVVSSFEMENTSQGTTESGVSVSFDPQFSLDMNKPITNDNSVSYSELPSSYFNLTFTNNFKNPVQFRMYITNKGESFNIGEIVSGPTHTNFPARNWNIHFIYMREFWVNAPDISTDKSGSNRIQYKPTEWHYVSAKDVSGAKTFQQAFNWEQINIVENKEYDLVVEYVPLHDTIYADCTVSSDEIVECYRQTFSLYKRPVSYNPDADESLGVLNIHGYDDYLTAENTAKGYIDDEGKTQIKDSFNVNKSPDSFGTGSGANQLYSSGKFSLSSLQSSTANVLSFFRYVFNFFPNQVWNAFYFIIICFVVFGFIKLLKG